MVKVSLKIPYEQKPVYHTVGKKESSKSSSTHFIKAQISMVTEGGWGRLVRRRGAGLRHLRFSKELSSPSANWVSEQLKLNPWEILRFTSFHSKPARLMTAILALGVNRYFKKQIRWVSLVRSNQLNNFSHMYLRSQLTKSVYDEGHETSTIARVKRRLIRFPGKIVWAFSVSLSRVWPGLQWLFLGLRTKA